MCTCTAGLSLCGLATRGMCAEQSRTCTQCAGSDAVTMEEEHRELLRSNRVYLTDNLDPSTFSNLLLQEKLLSDNEFELMEAEKTTKHKAEFLLGKLTRKGPDAFGKFLDVLRKTSGQEYIAEHIAKQLEQCDAGRCAVSVTGYHPSCQVILFDFDVVRVSSVALCGKNIVAIASFDGV